MGRIWRSVWSADAVFTILEKNKSERGGCRYAERRNHSAGMALYSGKAWRNFEIYCLLPAFIVSSLLIVVVSLCTEEPDDVVKQEFDQAKQLSMEE